MLKVITQVMISIFVDKSRKLKRRDSKRNKVKNVQCSHPILYRSKCILRVNKLIYSINLEGVLEHTIHAHIISG